MIEVCFSHARERADREYRQRGDGASVLCVVVSNEIEKKLQATNTETDRKEKVIPLSFFDFFCTALFLFEKCVIRRQVWEDNHLANEIFLFTGRQTDRDRRGKLRQRNTKVHQEMKSIW